MAKERLRITVGTKNLSITLDPRTALGRRRLAASMREMADVLDPNATRERFTTRRIVKVPGQPTPARVRVH